MTCSTQSFSVNGRTYRPPSRPLVAICLDGSADEYLNQAMALGKMPNLQKAIQAGAFRGMARGALPSFTNVNNSCIVTGVPPSIHGISGNFFYDPASGQEVMMNSAKYLRCSTILAAAAKAGRKVGVVTAKEKLRDILSHELTGAAFSSEKAREAKLETHGIEKVEELAGFPMPPIYSPDASLFVLRAGAAMIENGVADFLYLSLTDFMQHKYAPEAPEAVQFYSDIDAELGRMIKLGSLVAATADHGMNAKQKLDGSPNVIYLEDLLDQQFKAKFRVILPITDPYVRHHGALGSFAVIHLPDQKQQDQVRGYLNSLKEITEIYSREEAVIKLELPADRLGDLVVMCARDVVLGRSPAYHDLAALDAPLRSHGGRYEEMVPFIISEPLTADYRARANGDLRNFDLFQFLTNGTNHG